MSLISTVLLLAAVETPSPPTAVESSVLAAAYTRDASAADRRFKGLWLRVTGIAAEEPALYRRSPFVALEGNGIANRPVAVLDADREDELAGLRTGKAVALDCLGNGHVSGTPMLKNCTLVHTAP
ncbi:OB-fold protein [Xanthomonas phaseoli]|uniref:OB-fold protein n=1 Tax=Xanthomonas phaseoli TaxID=1985254 RepID=UPI003AFF767A